MLFIVSVTFFYLLQKQRHRPRNRVTDVEKCRQLIAADGQFMGKTNLLSPLASRELPNRPLRITFGIENAFTTPDEELAAQFVHRSRALVNVTAIEWYYVSRKIRKAARLWLAHPIEEIPIARLVQVLSLRLVIMTLLEIKLPVKVWNELYLANLASQINELWIISESDQTPPFAGSVLIREALSSLCPGYDLSQPRDNPLNLILPGFETTWRVALRLLLELRRGDPDWIDLVIGFSRRPTTGNLKERNSSGVCAEHLIFEALRLYPPTKRICRAFRWQDASKNIVEQDTYAADIEACHLSVDIWGQDAREFNPLRWANPTQGQKRAFMPFGAPPFECPAKPVFGPKMIGTIVGVLLQGLEEKGQWTTVDSYGREMDVNFYGARLSNARSAYDELIFRLDGRDAE
ncbi:hypothetical protein BO70DRAFT_285576 [Aspergillus heteromorphus CBS 117.55]|uniref:Cytochrome P450 n=1 Tax=Aspergillus heteromorphus CBS 117.55 TaxID=1448321 RepID=A0A317WV29_9EURO|nr:uncharacterized protein BO70DRAFT_285576 [Aspergillus heteromorphus CBS 117.55]PWY89162.1 hypothetical protein BO70DRAFT_285576 [Aspergillus heteromorphus CBS 117.55]